MGELSVFGFFPDQQIGCGGTKRINGEVLLKVGVNLLATAGQRGLLWAMEALSGDFSERKAKWIIYWMIFSLPTVTSEAPCVFLKSLAARHQKEKMCCCYNTINCVAKTDQANVKNAASFCSSLKVQNYVKGIFATHQIEMDLMKNSWETD